MNREREENEAGRKRRQNDGAGGAPLLRPGRRTRDGDTEREKALVDEIRFQRFV